jgi:hypothetical protein
LIVFVSSSVCSSLTTRGVTGSRACST